MLVPKEVIRPGNYWYEDDQGVPRCLNVTAADCQYWHDQGNKMLSSGVSVPIPFEHQKDLLPMTAAQKAAKQLQNNSGFIDSYTLQGDRLFALCDFDDKTYPNIISQLPRTIRYTSPWITSFTDGDGRRWEGCIGHLALTSRPRITRQEPFPDVAAALSLSSFPALGHALPLDYKKIGTGVFLSLAGELKRSNAAPPLTPARPKSFSVWSGVELARKPPEMSSTEDSPLDAPATKEEGKEGKEGVGTEEGKQGKDGEGDGKRGKSQDVMIDILCDLLDALFGIELPPDTDKKNLQQNLYDALREHLKSQLGGGDTDDPLSNKKDNTMPEKKADSQVVQEQQPLYFSLEDVQKMTDPAQRKMAEAVLSMQNVLSAEKKKTEALSKGALDRYKKALTARVERLKPTVTKATRDLLEKRLASVQLSLAEDGTVVDPMEEWLQALENEKLDMPALLQKGTDIIERAHPVEPSNNPRHISEERRKEVVSEIMANAGMRSLQGAGTK